MKNYRNILKCFLVFVLIVLCIDLVFNFSGILQENFETTINQAANNYNSNTTITPQGDIVFGPSHNKHIQSIVAKHSGKIINVKAIGQPPTKKVLVHFYGSSALTVNDDGTYSISLSNPNNIRQQWNIIYIPNAETYSKYIPVENKTLGEAAIIKGYNLNKAEYPFYIITSAHKPDRCLQYDTASILVRKIANYDSQKWDISYEKVDADEVIKTHKYDPMSLLSGEFRTDPHLKGANEYSLDSNKIKINLNLNNSSLSKLLGATNIDSSINNNNNQIDLDSSNSNNNSNSNGGYDINDCPDCDDKQWLSRNSIKSICPGCDTDKL